jgi:hypothetical protein
MAENKIFATVAETGDRAHEKACVVITPTSPIQCTILQLDTLFHNLAHQVEHYPIEAPSCSIVDCSSLVPDSPKPALYLLWITRVSTPGLFSLTCVGEHVRNQLVEGAKVVMSIFNDTGGYGDSGEALAAGTYMAVFKKVDVEKLRCVPVSFSTGEKFAIKEYIARVRSPVAAEERDEE